MSAEHIGSGLKKRTELALADDFLRKAVALRRINCVVEN